ncbi:hypothetical protein LENED_012182 [Lentinula edodes]|uniref:Uncharacterized protein n=1 Tax=Lentinula edodes TaxID=5353 RepID=A0A1Q3ES12_LENED|nr:hypothetical protein LENED_012182 [Lentinula edodes]
MNVPNFGVQMSLVGLEWTVVQSELAHFSRGLSYYASYPAEVGQQVVSTGAYHVPEFECSLLLFRDLRR